jgi:hypothetical protein
MAVTEPFPTLRVGAITTEPVEARWLVRDLWTSAAVGVIGGPPKAAKSWLGLDLSLSVASGTACLGRFEVDAPGPVLVYLAEDSLPQVRNRVAQLCEHRRLSIAELDLHVVTAPSVRLDAERDRRALDATLSALRPKLLLLDPLVRLHRLDENSAAEVSGLLGFLRELNRRYQVAVIVVHHMAKRARRDLGQALRGSSDLHAWTDSACYLVRSADQRLRLTVEHRCAPAPEPMLLHLAGGGAEPLRLQIVGADKQPPPLADAVRAALSKASEPCSRAALRRELRVNNARLGDVLAALERRGLAVRTPRGWDPAAQAGP